MRTIIAVTMTVLLGLGACTSTGTGKIVGATTCDANAAAMLVGKPAPDDASIRDQTGSRIVQRIAPGDPTTRDYRIERITVTIAEGRVVAASCG